MQPILMCSHHHSINTLNILTILINSVLTKTDFEDKEPICSKTPQKSFCTDRAVKTGHEHLSIDSIYHETNSPAFVGLFHILYVSIILKTFGNINVCFKLYVAILTHI